MKSSINTDNEMDITVPNDENFTLMNQNKIKHIQPKVPDGGYGWVIVAACFMCGMLVQGIIFSFGVFFIYFVDFYEAPKSKIAWIGSLLIGWTFLSGPLASTLANIFGFRPVVIFGSIGAAVAIFLSALAPSVEILQLMSSLAGIGFGLVFLPSFICVAHYFSTKRTFAAGIAISGPCVGSFIFPPFIHFMMNYYDFKGTMIILSGLVLNCMVFGALLRPPVSRLNRQKQGHLTSNGTCKILNEENDLKTPKTYSGEKRFETIDLGNKEIYCIAYSSKRQGKKSDNIIIKFLKGIIRITERILYLRLLRNAAFLLICISNLFALMGLSAPVMHLPHNAILKNVEPEKAVLLLSIFGAFNLFGRVILGYIIDKFKIRTVIVHNICACISGVAMLIIIFCSSYTSMSVVTAIIGFNIAAILSLQPLILVEIIGLPLLNNGLGLLSVFQGISMMLGPPLAGFLLDITGNYDVTFGIAGVFLILHAMALSVVPKIVRYRSSNANPGKEDNVIS